MAIVTRRSGVAGATHNYCHDTWEYLSMKAKAHVQGTEPVTEPLNLRRESRRFANDPLQPLVAQIGDHRSLTTHGDVGRYQRAYCSYALCLARVLGHISIGRRFQSQVRPRYGGRRGLSGRERAVSRAYRDRRAYFELDFDNYLMHSRIVLDRTIGLSRRFLHGPRLPSFTSFSDHKKFLKHHPTVIIGHESYAREMANETDWFDMPLKYLRDKFIVHSGPRHFRFLGYPSHHDLELLLVPADRAKKDEFSQTMLLRFSSRRFARDVDGFLKWYNAYALAATAPGQLTGC
jgi:hypothetical protein